MPRVEDVRVLCIIREISDHAAKESKYDVGYPLSPTVVRTGHSMGCEPGVDVPPVSFRDVIRTVEVAGYLGGVETGLIPMSRRQTDRKDQKD